MCAFRDTRDSRAFDMLFQRHSTRVYRYACGMVGCPASAEEILQEVFLTLTQSADRYQPRGYFVTWLLRLTRNRCLNCIESRRLRRMASTDDDLASPRPGPLEQAAISERLERVQEAVLQLPAPQREAILLYAMQDMDYRHIAQVLDMPVNTVKTLIHKARITLAEATEERDP
jgi:RNA polymerase sigma-70 factor (ECF subfamily)